MWKVPEIWKGATCFIIGGGNSLTEQFCIPEKVVRDVQSGLRPISDYSPYLSVIHDRHVIAVNMAYQLGNWVDFIFFGDRSFWTTNETKLIAHPSIKVTCTQSRTYPSWVRVMPTNIKKRQGITVDDRFQVSWNLNSGAAAINLAVYLGCSRIVLLGFDMNLQQGRSHWHGEYSPRTEANLISTFNRHKRAFEAVSMDAQRQGVEIINANPNSGLECFPKMDLTDVLKLKPPKSLLVETTVSVILTAWKTAQWIEQCLDSIYAQTFRKRNELEVLLAIDNCPETLDKVLEIRSKYPGLKVFRSMENVGTYMLSNSLLKLATGEYIIRFDTDDLMLPTMIQELANAQQRILRWRYARFEQHSNRSHKASDWTCGQIWIDRSILRSAGGWRAWQCAADANLIARLENKYMIGQVNQVLFLKRMHPLQLTKKEDTGMRSELRDFYRKLTTQDKTRGLFRIKMETVELKPV